MNFLKQILAGNTGDADYFLWHAAQLPVLRRQGQMRLRQARVHVSATGRIGASVAMRLAEAGVGEISANDPQRVEPENFGPWVFVRRPDLGREKVYVLARFFSGRPHFAFASLVAPTESRIVNPYTQRAPPLISCANTVRARLAAERKAIRYQKPVMQVAVIDGRKRLKGFITIRLPENQCRPASEAFSMKSRSSLRGRACSPRSLQPLPPSRRTWPLNS